MFPKSLLQLFTFILLIIVKETISEPPDYIVQTESSNDQFKLTLANFDKAENVINKVIVSEKDFMDVKNTVTGLKQQHSSETKYEPTWDSLDARPLPKWYDEAKIGIFIHWGVFSVPSYGSEWMWNKWNSKRIQDFLKLTYPLDVTYQDFAKEFTTEFYNPNQWADLFAEAGAKYVVLTSKHHEGYTLWPSKYAFSWNSMDVGPKRNLVGELAEAMRTRHPEIKFGLYHSLFEFFNPLYLADKEANFTTDNFVQFKTLPELYELVNEYKPEVIWSDGEWEAPASYWKSREFLAWLYNESPVKNTVVVNDRWCNTCLCKHGGYLTCQDRYKPDQIPTRKFEGCFTIDRSSWGYLRNSTIDDYLTIQELLSTIMGALAKGGNALVNVGPTKEGTISPIYQERLKQMGQFLKINGEAIYSSHPWLKCQNQTLNSNYDQVWYTKKNESDLFVTFVTWPKTSELRLNLTCIHPDYKDSITLLGYDDKPYSPDLKYAVNKTTSQLIIELPSLPKATSVVGWTLKLPNVPK